MTLLGVDMGTTHVKAAPTTKTAGSSALASGLVERAPLSFSIIFLGLGFLIGERDFGLLTVGPEDPTLETIAILTLALVLFLDAVHPEAEEVRGAGLVPVLLFSRHLQGKLISSAPEPRS